MWYRVLTDGIHESIFGVSHAGRKASERYRQEAYDWILNEDSDGIGSFNWVIQELSECPDYASCKIREFVKTHSKPGRPWIYGGNQGDHLLALTV